MIFRVWGLLLALIFCSSCSYRWGYTERSLPGNYKKVAISVFNNNSDIVGVEGAFTNSLIHQFAKSRVAEVVGKKRSEVFITGTITNIRLVHGGSVSVDSSNLFETADGEENAIRLPENTVLTTEYRVLTTARIELRKTLDKKLLWQGTVQGERVYPAPQVGLSVVNSVNPLYNHNARIKVIEAMSGDMMAEAHDRMTENF